MARPRALGLGHAHAKDQTMTERGPLRSDTAFIPEGAFTYQVANPNPTKWLGFLLLPEFTLLAFSSAVDPLRIANQLAQQPLYGWKVFSEDGAPVASSSGLSISVDGPFESAEISLPIFVCSGNHWNKAASDKTLAQLRRRNRFGAVHGGICTGAATLARAGLLKDKRFTLHWENQPGFAELYPDLDLSPNRYEIDGPLQTSGGGSAATELMLIVISKDYGPEFAAIVADMCLNNPDLSGRQSQRSSIATAVATRNPKLVDVVQDMYQNIEEPLPLADLALNAGVSRRQMERLFQRHLGFSPAAIYRNIRLERARSLLIETDRSVREIASATGFNSTTLFARHFKSKYGATPYGTRKQT